MNARILKELKEWLDTVINAKFKKGDGAPELRFQINLVVVREKLDEIEKKVKYGKLRLVK